MLILSFIAIAILSFLLIGIIIKGNSQRKEIKVAEDFHRAVWENAHEFIFLIDETSHVAQTNYYLLCDIPVNNNKRCFGEILQCHYAREAGCCNKHEQCKSCPIRTRIKETFANRSGFRNFETTMDICIANRPASLYNMIISGCYLELRGHGYVMLTVHDISEERALESSLKHSNEKFLCFFDNATVGCAICNKDGKLMEVNDTYVQYMGIESKEVAVDQLNIYTNPCIDPEFKRMMKAGIPVAGEVKYDYAEINRHYVKSRHKDVHYFRFIVNYLFDTQGHVENILIIWVENTLIHKTLRQNKTFSDMITAASSVSKIGFSSINLMKDEQLVTPEYLDNLGLSQEIDQHSLLSHLMKLYSDDFSVFQEYIEKARSQEMPPLERNIRVMVNGKYKWIKQYLIQQTFDPDNGNIILLGVNVDIDAQKRTEEELRQAKEKAESSDRLKSAFLANMSHEIRTPLNAIIGFSDLLVTAENRSEMESFKQIIEQNSNQLLQLIGDILDFSKIESGTLEFEWSNVNVNAIIVDLEKLFQLKNQNPDIEIKCVLGMDDCVIRTERQRLGQVLSNLMVNALKFTTKGTITLGYECLETEMYFYVEDTGCGIPEELQSRVFQRFVQLDSFKSGTGLGLPICSSIVKVMGGKIGVNSQPGKGSKFWFTLPVQPIKGGQE